MLSYELSRLTFMCVYVTWTAVDCELGRKETKEVWLSLCIISCAFLSIQQGTSGSLPSFSSNHHHF